MAKPFKRNDRWYQVVELPRHPDGSRNQRWLNARTRADVERQARHLMAQIDKGTYVEPSLEPVETFITEWYERQGYEGQTDRNYRSVMRTKIIPAIGQIPLSRLTVRDVESMIHRYADTPTSVRIAFALLSKAFGDAVRYGLIPSSPVSMARKPRIRKASIVTWTADELDRFLSQTIDHPHHPVWVIASYTGMRRGEILGLPWDNVDFDRRLITVDRQLTPQREIRTMPKTKAGHRVIPMRSVVVDALRQQRRRQLEQRLFVGDLWKDTGFVFTDDIGDDLAPDTISTTFMRVSRSLGLPSIKFHDLRHTAATQMLAGGVSLFEVSRILGHASISITADTYGHLEIDSLQASIDRLDRAFQG